MTRMSIRIYEDLLKRLVDELKEYFGDELISVILYGSFARGEAKKESDIDLLVICEDLPKEKLKRQDIFLRIEGGVERGIGDLPFISPILKTKEEAKVLSPLYLDMVEDAKILYDKDDFFKDILCDLRLKLDLLKARRVKVGKKWYWDLKPDYKFGEVIRIE